MSLTPTPDHDKTGDQTLETMNEQELILELMRRGVSVRLLCGIGLPEARRKHMQDALKRARMPDTEHMSEQDLDRALIQRGVSTRLLHLIGLPEARIAAKREALRKAS